MWLGRPIVTAVADPEAPPTADEPAPRTRISKVERRKAIAEYQSALLAGKNPRDARHEIQVRYGVSRHTANLWIRVAGRRWMQRAEGDRDQLHAQAVARFDEVFARALEARDFSSAIRALVEQSTLLDLYPPDATQEFQERAAEFVRTVLEIMRDEVKDFVAMQRVAARCRELLARSRAKRAPAIVVDAEPVATAGLTNGAAQ